MVAALLGAVLLAPMAVFGALVLWAGATLVVVTHNIPSARVIGDELVFLHEGRILARGAAAALDQSDEPLVRRFMRSEGAG